MLLSRLGFAVIIAILITSPLSAQTNPPIKQQLQMQQLRQLQQMQSMEIKGVLEGQLRGRIMVIDENQQPWQIVVPPTAEVHVTGPATPDCLKPGMLIEFSGEIDDRGQLKEKVEELAIISPSQEKQIGLFPTDSTQKHEEGAEGTKETPGKKKTKPTKRSGKTIPAGVYRIIGHLTVGRNGKMTVAAGLGSFTLELTEEPTITVDVRDYSIASKGDSVSVKGIMMANQPGMAQATAVTIELSNPLSGPPQKAPGGKPESKRPPKKTEKESGSPEPPEK